MPPARATLSWREGAIGGLIIFGLLLLAYSPALRGSFLWDDPAHVTRADLRSLDGLRRIWTDVRATQQYYPVLHTAFWIEHRIWGDYTIAYHLVNLFWHALAAVLLAAGIRRVHADTGTADSAWKRPDLTAREGSTHHNREGLAAAASAYSNIQYAPGTISVRGLAWGAALLFALHPMSVESVAWISEQKNTLSLVFYLAAALLYWRFIERRRVLDYVFALVIFLLALGSKSVTATLPAAILVVLWWRHGELSGKRDVVPLLPWFMVAIASGLFTAWVERTVIGAEGGDFSLSLLQRGGLAARVICFYTGKLLWPAHLSFFYERWEIRADFLAWLRLLAVIAVTVAFWALRKRTRGVLAGWLLFVGSLFPALGFFNVFPFRFSYVADHFQYLPSLYFLAWIVFGAAWLAGEFRLNTPRIFGGAGAAVLALLLTLARAQSTLYRNNEILFRATIRATPSSWMGHGILASTLAKQSDHEAEAIAEYRTTIDLNSRYPDAHLGLANLLVRAPATHDEAMREYERALELRPNYAEAHSNLGLQLMKIPPRRAEAVAHFEKALAIRPDLPEAHMNLADALASDPRHRSEAIGHYREALRLRHPYALVHAHLGRALLQTGEGSRVREAVEELREAIREDPSLAEAHYYLAGALIQSPSGGAEALEHAEAAVRLQPGNVQVLDGLGIVYARQNRFEEARDTWQKALQLDPQDRMARANLDRLRDTSE